VWRDTAEKMLRWLDALIHPDEEIAFFNDAAFRIASSPYSLREYAERLDVHIPYRKKESICKLESSGYVRIAKGDAVVLMDVASVGPDYIPGHAHADTMSFEFSLFGQRILVNSGTSIYEAGEERLRQRGTAAHNTVQIDGENSSEVWSSFRVAKRARPFDLQAREEESYVEVRCGHDGYKRLSGNNIHRRRWRLSNHSFEISDNIEGRFQSAVARYHLHPNMRIGGKNKLQLPDGKSISFSVIGGLAKVVETTWHPEFGKTVKSQCVEVEFHAPVMTMAFAWS
jgi:uncharacterized heparinase superfamily protein